MVGLPFQSLLFRHLSLIHSTLIVHRTDASIEEFVLREVPVADA